MPQLEFTGQEATVHKAIVVSLDLAGFSDFCNQPEASIVAPKLTERFFDQLNGHFYETGDGTFFAKDPVPGKLPEPSFIKFTGDGALMLWVCPVTENFPQAFCDQVVEVMRKFQQNLHQNLPNWEREWHVHRLPKRVRVGIATGVVYALRPPHLITSWTEPCDYVGYCINLAVRFQSHCREAGFLVHGTMHPSLTGMVALRAVKMKGTQEEPVVMFDSDLLLVPVGVRQKKFRT